MQCVLPRRSSLQSVLVLRRVVEFSQGDYCLCPRTDPYEFVKVFSITDPGAGCRYCVSIILGLVPRRSETLVQANDLKLRSGHSVVHCFVDFRISAAQVEPADPD